MCSSYSDDLKHSLGCYGAPVRRPTRQARLARCALRSRLCQYPLCGPSRCSLMSGMRRRDRLLTMADRARQGERCRHAAAVLPQNGTSRRASGRFITSAFPAVGTPGPDDPPSWDHTFNPKGMNSLRPTTATSRSQPENVQSFRYNMLKGDGQSSTISRPRRSIRLMTSTGRPFFLALGFIRPHVPEVGPKSFFDLYPIDQIKRRMFPRTISTTSRRWRWEQNDFGMTPQQCIDRSARTTRHHFMDAQAGGAG